MSADVEPIDKLEGMILPLLNWYRDHARTLPWRSDCSAYRVWVSEIMLQQTRVAAVIGYFNRFMSALPDISSLARVSEDELLKLWQGLGYYNRARNLRRAAQVIVNDWHGEMPGDYESIRALPGIGDYTAGAIGSIVFRLPVPAVDGNVLRVLTRVLGDTRDISAQSTKNYFRELLLQVIPREAPGEFNQSLMELGALICLPNGIPKCTICPLHLQCAACLQNRTAELPRKAQKKQRRIEERTVWLIFYDGCVALRRRPERGLLAGLWEYPNECGMDNALHDWGITASKQESGLDGKHIFTHIEWQMHAIIVNATSDDIPNGWVWASRSELEQVYAVPNAFQSFTPVVKERLKYDL